MWESRICRASFLVGVGSDVRWGSEALFWFVAR